MKNQLNMHVPVRVVAVFLLVASLSEMDLMAHIDRTGIAWLRTAPVSVDGNLEEWVDVAPLDSSGQLRVQWDSEYLYLALQIKDSELLETPDKHELYLGDSVEIGLDLGNDGTFTYESDDYQIVFSVPDANNKVDVVMYRHGGERREVDVFLKAAGRRTAGDYAIEVSMEWTAMGPFRPSSRKSIGFEFVVSDFATGIPTTRFRWSDMQYSMREPIRWGDLVFLENGDSDSDAVIQSLAGHREKYGALFSARYEDPVPEGPVSELVRQDMDKLREGLILQWNRSVEEVRIKNYIDTLSADGSWPVLPYEERNDGYLSIEIKRHLYWLLDLAISWHFEGSAGHGDPEVLQAIHRSLNFWLEKDFTFRNWWENEIGVPMIIGRVALLMGDELTTEEFNRVIPVLRRAYNTMTGQNLVWINRNILMRGILQENPALVQKALNAIASEIRITTEEGIQPDYSFHQHGSMLYNHGYGAGFLSDGLSILSCAAGGSFEIDPEKREIIERYLLDGSRWMARGTFPDYGAMGRNVTRNNQSAAYLGQAARLMLTFDTNRAEELQRLALSATSEGSDELEGNRHFYRSDFMVHRRKAFYTSVKMYSTRTIGTESINGEGLKSYYLPDGCMFVLQEGDEYEEIQPIWDWRKLPGVTCPQSDEPIPTINYRETRTSGNTSFVGGVSDGWYGCSVFDYQRDGVSVRKGYFGFDWGVVCLGTGLTSDRPEPIATTLNQCYLRTNVLAGKDISSPPTELCSGASITEELSWAYHDDVLYCFEGRQDVSLRTVGQTGSWWEINRGGSKEPVTADIFTLSLQHGIGPQGEKYAYAVLPGMEKGGIRNILANLPYRILANTPELQAVSDIEAGVTECIFYKPGSVELDSGAILSVDKPCVLLLTDDADGRTLAVANPENQALRVVVAFSEDAESKSVETVFELPGDVEHAGATICRRMRQ